jgi:hypothetical protein
MRDNNASDESISGHPASQPSTNSEPVDLTSIHTLLSQLSTSVANIKLSTSVANMNDRLGKVEDLGARIDTLESTKTLPREVQVTDHVSTSSTTLPSYAAKAAPSPMSSIKGSSDDNWTKVTTKRPPKSSTTSSPTKVKTNTSGVSFPMAPVHEDTMTKNRFVLHWSTQPKFIKKAGSPDFNDRLMVDIIRAINTKYLPDLGTKVIKFTSSRTGQKLGDSTKLGGKAVISVVVVESSTKSKSQVIVSGIREVQRTWMYLIVHKILENMTDNDGLPILAKYIRWHIPCVNALEYSIRCSLSYFHPSWIPSSDLGAKQWAMKWILDAIQDVSFSEDLEKYTSEVALAQVVGIHHYEVGPKPKGRSGRSTGGGRSGIIMLAAANTEEGTALVRAIFTCLRREGTSELYPITVFGGLTLNLTPCLESPSDREKVLKKLATRTAKMEADYYVIRVDAVNPAFVHHPEWAVFATKSFDNLRAILPSFPDGADTPGATMIFGACHPSQFP